MSTEMSASAAVHFRPSDEILPAARTILARVRAELAPLLPTAEIELTGSSSRSGRLTRGDIDLHLRSPIGEVEAAIVVLEAAGWTAVHRSMWTSGFATFERRMDRHEVGVAVTAIGDEHDTRFRSTWQRLAAEPALADAYDRLKRRHEGGSLEAYQIAKGAFFADLHRATVPPGRAAASDRGEED